MVTISYLFNIIALLESDDITVRMRVILILIINSQSIINTYVCNHARSILSRTLLMQRTAELTVTNNRHRGARQGCTVRTNLMIEQLYTVTSLLRNWVFGLLY